MQCGCVRLNAHSCKQLLNKHFPTQFAKKNKNSSIKSPVCGLGPGPNSFRTIWKCDCITPSFIKCTLCG